MTLGKAGHFIYCYMWMFWVNEKKKSMKKKTAVQIKGWKKRERSIRCVNSSQEVVLPTLSSRVLFLFSNDQHSFFDIPKMLPRQYIICWLITDLYKKITQLESNRIMLEVQVKLSALNYQDLLETARYGLHNWKVSKYETKQC